MKILFTLLSCIYAMVALGANEYSVITVSSNGTPATDTVFYVTSDSKITGYYEKMYVLSSSGHTQNIFIVASNSITGKKTTLVTTNRMANTSEIFPRYYPANSNGVTVSSCPEKYFLYQEYIIVGVSNAFTSNNYIRTFHFYSK